MWAFSSSSASQLTPQKRLCLKRSTGRSRDSAMAASSEWMSVRGISRFMEHLIITGARGRIELGRGPRGARLFPAADHAEHAPFRPRTTRSTPLFPAAEHAEHAVMPQPLFL